MSIAQSLLPEFDHEMAITRRVLERVPADHADWQPHAKSMTLGQLAAHMGNIPRWGVVTIRQDEFDMAKAGDGQLESMEFSGSAALIQRFDTNVAEARELLAGASDEHLMQKWSFRSGDHTIFTLPRVAVLRTLVLSHIIHHRGQMSVYLRLRDVPVPSIYGPSADEQ